MINVIKSDVESTCFCCPVPTRLVLITEMKDFPMCIDCILVYDEILRAATYAEMLDVRLVDRHINN